MNRGSSDDDKFTHFLESFTGIVAFHIGWFMILYWCFRIATE